MMLNLKHTELDVFQVTKKFVLSCYQETKAFPAEEKFGMIAQIRRAALSTLLNIAEGCSRKSEIERKRYFEVARGSVIEIDTAFDIALTLNYLEKEQLFELSDLLIRSFQLDQK